METTKAKSKIAVLKSEIREPGSYTKELSREKSAAPATPPASEAVALVDSGSEPGELDRVLNREVKSEGELAWEYGLRPQQFEDFPGQDKVKEKLKVFVGAAKA